MEDDSTNISHAGLHPTDVGCNPPSASGVDPPTTFKFHRVISLRMINSAVLLLHTQREGVKRKRCDIIFHLVRSLNKGFLCSKRKDVNDEKLHMTFVKYAIRVYHHHV